MRAHFQNEHVGGNEGVKSCPLCAYRATSMKSLRVHFYNRYSFFFPVNDEREVYAYFHNTVFVEITKVNER